ncbi:MAG: 50S ribosomal protein L25/general stress protein Ctc [Maricaulaceae bacterium]
MADAVLDVVVREETGTGNARAARRDGFVPGVLYGGGQDPVSIQLKHNEVIRVMNKGNLLQSMVELSHDGKKQKALTKDVQFHPVSDLPVHIDFFRVTNDTIIDVVVPAVFVGDEVSPGIKRGGILNVVRYNIEVKCPAGSIPDSLTVDISNMDIGDAIHISEVNLPDGVKQGLERDFTIATIVSSRASKEADDGTAGGEDAAEGDAAATEGGDA